VPAIKLDNENIGGHYTPLQPAISNRWTGPSDEAAVAVESGSLKNSVPVSE